jgi:hypothetical protein
MREMAPKLPIKRAPSKFEARNPKFETNPNVQNSNILSRFAVLELLNFEFVSDFDIRISDFLMSPICLIPAPCVSVFIRVPLTLTLFLEGGSCEKNEPGAKASFVARGRGNFLPSKPGGRYKAVKHCPVFRRATSALAETLINPNRGSLGFGEFDTERATEK